MPPGEDTRSRPTLYLHIGAPKTGTSAIQAFLTLNRDAFLAATGIYYPESRSDARVLKGKPTAGNGAKIAKLLRSKRRDAFDQAIALTEAELGRGRERLLLSSEGFWSIPDDAMEAFLARASPLADVRFLFYARPQVKHVESAYLQVLGNRGFDGDIAAYFETVRPKFFVGSKLERLTALAGAGKVTARKYDRKSLVGGDVIDDFVDVFGTRFGDAFQRPQEVNSSLDAEHYLYARAASGSGGGAGAGKAKRAMRGLAGDPVLASLYADAQAISGLRIMDPDTARRIASTYEADNDLLDRLAPEAGFDFNAENSRAVEALEAADAPAQGLTRLELLLLNRLAQLEVQVAQLSGAADPAGEADDDDD